jgi:integrase
MPKPFALPPGLRIRAGRFHYRFTVAGIEYSGRTAYVATERNLTAAMRKLEQARQAVEAGGQPPKLAPRIFSDAAAAFLDWKEGEHRAHPATARRVATSFVSLQVFFQGMMLHQITPGQVEDYKAWRRSSQIKDITLRHDLHALSQIFEYGKKHQWCMANPVKQVKMPTDRHAVRQHVVSPAEEEVYFAAAAKYPVFHDAVRLVLLTGMRPDEVLHLTPADVDLERSLVRVGQGKTKAARRTIRLVPEASEVLARRMAAAVGGRMWIGPRGARRLALNPTHYRVLKKTKLRFTIYELRHTFASRMADAGCPLPILAAILGHGSLRTVGRYVHPSQAAQEEAIILYATRSGIGPGTPIETHPKSGSTPTPAKAPNTRPN